METVQRQLALARETARYPPPAARPASIVPVTNCNDSGPGSLRDAASIAINAGDTIDMSALTSGTITLTTGSVGVFDVVLQGPGQSALTIDANRQARVIVHQGGGTLAVNDPTLYGGNYYTPLDFGRSGCLYSFGSVVMIRSTVEFCEIYQETPGLQAAGGAISTIGSLVLSESTAEVVRRALTQHLRA